MIMHTKELLLKKYYFSIHFANNIYKWTGEYVPNLLNQGRISFFDASRTPYIFHGNIQSKKTEPKTLTSPKLLMVSSKNCYYAKSITTNDQEEIERYKRIISNPPKIDDILWPTDIIFVDKEQQSSFGLSVEQEYSNLHGYRRNAYFTHALVFNYCSLPAVAGADQLVSKFRRHGFVDWKREEIRHLAVSIVKAIDQLNASGYVLYDMHFSRFYFKQDGAAFLDFSDLIYPLHDTPSPDRSRIPLEFADPLYYNKLVASLSLQTQNYCLSAMLFYLFFDRHPYECDNILATSAEDNIDEQYAKYEACLAMPFFIFSSGAMIEDNDKNNRSRLLWEDFPTILKDYFKDSLIVDFRNDFSHADRFTPTPSCWLSAFQKLGWG